ncbi:MAG: TRAP transporter large permease subunit [Deltaproteobacteria bacterium]|nr:TRAP transporter large permease subunit [Deltaproteobacteria bacterium]
MEWQYILLIIVGGLLISLMSGLPVFVAFLLTDIIGILFFMGGLQGLSSIIRSILDSIGVFTLAPVPLFIIMGEVIFVSGMASKAIDVVERILYRLPGRLSMVAVGAGALFDCLSGSALGTCAMFGSLLVPEMSQRRYSKYMSMGPIMAGSALAVVIPPSTLAIVLAAQAGISIGKLLIAGFIPGFMLASLFSLYIITSCMIKPSLAPAAGQALKRASSPLLYDFLKYLLPLSLIVLAVLGGIFSGIATPTEASALGALTSFILAAVYRRLNRKVIVTSGRRCLAISTMILMIVAGSVAFSQLLAFTGITRGIVGFASELPVSPKLIVALILCVLLLMGTMIEQISMIMIGVPIFMPVAVSLGYDPIWFGLLMLVCITIGLITPPFGLLLFIMKGVTPPDIKMTDVYLAAIPFITLALLGVILILIFPAIATWLPNIML